MITYRPCTFYVEHAVIDTSRGGRQSDPQTNGPYRGMLTAPGSIGAAFQRLAEVASTAGFDTQQSNWTLLMLPNVAMSFGGEASDYVTVVGIGRFEVNAVRPLSNIVPPVALVASLDLRT